MNKLYLYFMLVCIFILSYCCFVAVYGLSETGLITGCYEGAFKLGSSGVLTIGTRLKVCILTCPGRSINP